jgi:hypothetical protein
MVFKIGINKYLSCVYKCKKINLDGVVKSLIYRVVAVLQELDILYRIVSSLKNHHAFLSR